MAVAKQSFRSGPFKDLYAQGVKTGNVLYLAGQVGVDAAGTPGCDLQTQVTLAYQNIGRVLAEFDADMSNIVDETMFVCDMAELMRNSDAVFSARAQAYGGSPEVTQTVLQVSALVMPQLKVEIKCIAHL